MKYSVMHVALENYENQLWREIAFSGNPTLMELAVLLGNTFQAEFYVDFGFFNNDHIYANKGVIPSGEADNALPLDNLHLSDLNPVFHYIYDFDDKWTFQCTLQDKKMNFTNKPYAFVIDGAGQGIFEMNRESFEAYMDGTILPEDDNDSLEEKNLDFHLPKNMDLNCFGDFENPLNLTEMTYTKKEIKQSISFVENFKKMIADTDDALWDKDWDDDYDDEDDDPEEIAQRETLFYMARSIIACQIFEDPDINQEYRRLIQKYDINEAYHMIVDASFQYVEKAGTSNTKEFSELILNAVKKLQ